MDSRDAARRARRQRDWSVSIQPLGAESSDDLTDCTSAEERVALVWTLTERMWELTGRPLPTYRRSEMPVVVIRTR
jgi:hypothetical protein